MTFRRRPARRDLNRPRKLELERICSYEQMRSHSLSIAAQGVRGVMPYGRHLVSLPAGAPMCGSKHRDDQGCQRGNRGKQRYPVQKRIDMLLRILIVFLFRQE